MAGVVAGAAHHAADAFFYEPDIGDVTSQSVRRPTVALEDFENLFALQFLWKLGDTAKIATDSACRL